MEAQARWALILAGGDGTRLQDVTRAIAGRPIPKQYCRLLDDRTLLEATFDRVAHFVGRQHTMLLVNRNHLSLPAAAARYVPRRNLVAQPCNRDTGPGITLGLLHLARRAPNALVAMFPSDHFVDDVSLFMEHVDMAARVVSKWPEKLAVIGVEPRQPDPELGYMTVGDRVAGVPNAHGVRGFAEKPMAMAAGALIRAGALWNSLVMVFRVQRMLELLEAVLPYEARCIRHAARSPGAAEAFAALQTWSFSRDFLAKIAPHLIVVKLEGVYWSDWGTRAAIEQTMAKLQLRPPWLRGLGPAA